MALREFNGLAEITEHDAHGVHEGHRHFAAYAAIALQGEYTEVSADGALDVAPGDVVIHPPFHQHTNFFATLSVTVLNLILPMSVSLTLNYTRLRLAELPCSQNDIIRRPRASAAAIARELARTSPVAPHPTSADAVGLAWRRLKQRQAPKVYAVAAEAGVSTEHLTRAFRARYGLSPAVYRAEHRFRHAQRGLLAGDAAVVVASSNAYSDQSHMTRDFRQRLGLTPVQFLRRLHDPRYVQH